ncbi:1433_t:CDS:1, partial [Gigaspora margarita]
GFDQLLKLSTKRYMRNQTVAVCTTQSPSRIKAPTNQTTQSHRVVESITAVAIHSY